MKNFSNFTNLQFRVFYLISATAGAAFFEITETKIYVPVVIPSVQNSSRLLQQLKSEFQETIGKNINQKYQRKPKIVI